MIVVVAMIVIVIVTIVVIAIISVTVLCMLQDSAQVQHYIPQSTVSATCMQSCSLHNHRLVANHVEGLPKHH